MSFVTNSHVQISCIAILVATFCCVFPSQAAGGQKPHLSLTITGPENPMQSVCTGGYQIYVVDMNGFPRTPSSTNDSFIAIDFTYNYHPLNGRIPGQPGATEIGEVYLDAGCTIPGNELVVPAGLEHTQGFYLKPDEARTGSLRATSPGIAQDQLQITVEPLVARRLQIESPQEAFSNECLPLTLSRLTEYWQPAPEPFPRSVTLNAPEGINFYADQFCEDAQDVVTLPENQAELELYFRSQEPGDYMFSAYSEPLIGDVQTVNLASRHQFKPIVGNVPPVIDGQNSSMLLWGRHTSKFVRLGSYRYAALQTHPVHPRDLKIYRFDENNEAAGWQLAWTGPRIAHQPPSLVADHDGALHLIFPYDQGTPEHQGKVVHYRFPNAATGSLTSELIDTSSWGQDNYYFGVSIGSIAGRVYLCSQNWESDTFRCGFFLNNSWYGPYSLLSSANRRYLYPTMVASGHRLWLMVGVRFYQAPECNGECPTNAYEKILLREYANYGQTFVRGYTVANHIGNAVNGHYPFHQDISFDPDGNIWALVKKASTDNSGPNTLVRIDRGNGDLTQTPVACISGAQHNLFVESASAIHIFGRAKDCYTNDGGVNWAIRYFPEAEPQPYTNYLLQVAHTLKPQSGSALEDGAVHLLQQIRNSNSGAQKVYEITVGLD